MKLNNQKTLKEIYNNYKSDKDFFSFSGDKGSYHSYIDYYQFKFQKIRDNKINFLEIGVYDGKSLEMFNQFFTKANLFGVDITDQYIENKRNINFKLILGHQADHKIYKDLPKFDLIIDDGSGRFLDQINTLKFLYHKLKFNGSYYIEDISDLDLTKNDFLNMNKFINIYDFRNISNRFDDVLIEINKPMNLYTLFKHFVSYLRYKKNIYS